MSVETPRFNQDRKDDVAAVAGQVRACLRDYYDPAGPITSAESVHSDAYETEGAYDAVHLLDYAGIDWLVDQQPAIVPVGERVRPNTEGRRDFSLRLDNGCARPCEAERLPAGLARGIAPETLLFGWHSDDTLDRAWLLDCQRLVEAVTFDEVAVDERASGDGTVAGYIGVGDLVAADVVLAAWDDPTEVSGE